MKYVLILAALLATGCTAVPRPQYAPVDTSACRAVEGSQVRMSRDGRAAYKYMCGGQPVWAVKM